MAVLVTEVAAALQASISVLLVLGYGALAQRLNFLSSDSRSAISTLCASIFLPCLLFSEMGPHATVHYIKEYWILPIAALFFMSLSFAWGAIGHKLLKLPDWIIPACAFNNVVSLPLLLVQSLSKTGAIDRLLRDDSDSIDDALRRARNYLLINALVCNIVRFATGPRLLKSRQSQDDDETARLLPEHLPNGKQAPVNNSEGEEIKSVWQHVKKLLNPPLIGGLLAIFFGIIPILHKQVFEEGGLLYGSVTQSIENIGKLYTALQMFVLGAKLVVSKKGKVALIPLLYLLAYRFAVLPLISNGLVYGLRSKYPNWIARDPILDFILAVNPVGPPALTLAAIAQMAHLDEEEDAAISQMMMVSYFATPMISIPVSSTMYLVGRLYQ